MAPLLLLPSITIVVAPIVILTRASKANIGPSDFSRVFDTKFTKDADMAGGGKRGRKKTLANKFARYYRVLYSLRWEMGIGKANNLVQV